jgi:hypothetical protein
MASGRPIIAAVDRLSATADLVRAADCGIVVAPEDTCLTAGIERLHRARHGPTHGSNGRMHVVERFSKGAVLGQWDALLAEVVSGRDASPTRAD